MSYPDQAYITKDAEAQVKCATDAAKGSVSWNQQIRPLTVSGVINGRLEQIARTQAELIKWKDNLPRECLDMSYDEYTKRYRMPDTYPF